MRSHSMLWAAGVATCVAALFIVGAKGEAKSRYRADYAVLTSAGGATVSARYKAVDRLENVGVMSGQRSQHYTVADLMGRKAAIVPVTAIQTWQIYQ